MAAHPEFVRAAPELVEARAEAALQELLRKYEVEEALPWLVHEGVTRREHLSDLSEQDVQDMGLGRVTSRRFKRMLAEAGGTAAAREGADAGDGGAGAPEGRGGAREASRRGEEGPDGGRDDSKQKEFDKLQQENVRIVKEIEGFRAEIDTLKKSVKGKMDELKQTRQLLQSTKDQRKPVQSERERELKRERDELDTQVMKLEWELKNIQRIKERMYQVEIMKLMTENEELKRAEKMKNTIEPKAQGGMTEGKAENIAAPALTSALAQLRARRTTAQGGPPK